MVTMVRLQYMVTMVTVHHTWLLWLQYMVTMVTVHGYYGHGYRIYMVIMVTVHGYYGYSTWLLWLL